MNCPCENKQHPETGGTCPAFQMTAVPILAMENIADFNPNDTTTRRVYQFVNDPRNGVLYFYDIYGGVHLIGNEGRFKVQVEKKLDKKQNTIEAYNPEKFYREGDLIIKDFTLYVAVIDNSGAFIETNWHRVN